MAVAGDGPGGVPGNFPNMLVGIGDIAAKAAVGRAVGKTQEPSPGREEALHQRLHLFLVDEVVGEGESTGARKAPAVHVGLERVLQESPEEEAVHLVEDDLLVLEDRPPAEALLIKAP